MVVRAGVLLLAPAFVSACVRAAPISAPTVVVVESIRDGAFAPFSEGPVESAASWQARDEVEVEWQGAWFPAVVVEKRGTRWLIHYEGYGTDWDELVGVERIRERRAGTMPETTPVDDELDP